MGLKSSDLPPPQPVYVWPENKPAFDLFCRLSSQWRVGMNGAYGLDMSVFMHELDRKNVPEGEYDYALWALGVMEVEALKAMEEQSK